jgi:hypothetical protein
MLIIVLKKSVHTFIIINFSKRLEKNNLKRMYNIYLRFK